MNPEPKPGPSHRREFARQRSFLRGLISFNNGRNTYECRIRDVSSHGARLVFPRTVPTPDVFNLYISQKEQTRPVRVTWRSDEEVGVAFVQTSARKHLSEFDDLTQRVSQLEVEIGALKRAFKRLKIKADPEGDAA